MKSALINIVRRSAAASSEHDFNYSNQSNDYVRHEEVRLETEDGEPCAIPTLPPVEVIDYKYTYVNGSIGQSMRGMRRGVDFSIDYISSDVRNKLERMMSQRAVVQICPGYGANTMFAYRPLLLSGSTFNPSGTTAADLTGAFSILHTGGASEVYWDIFNSVMRGQYAANKSRIVVTPGGAGEAAHRATSNRWFPSYPESATASSAAGAAGWYKGGTDAAQITFTHMPNSFGQAACPDALRITTPVTLSSSRYIRQTHVWDSGHVDYNGYTFTGSGTATVTIWLRGHLPYNSYIRFNHGSDNVDVYPRNLDLSDWTPVTLQLYEADWSTAVPQVIIRLEAATNADRADFEIGPSMMSFSASSARCEGPMWIDNAETAADCYPYIQNADIPAAGTIFASVYWPSSHQPSGVKSYVALYYCNGLFFLIYRDSGNNNWYLQFHDGVALRSSLWSDGPNIGGVNTFALAYRAGHMAVYANGKLVEEWSTQASQDRAMYQSNQTMRIGATTTYSCFPCLITSLRVDRTTWDLTEVQKHHAQLADPAAIALWTATQGRLYHISEIPGTPRPAAGGTQWLGRLSLEQVGYEHDYAAFVTREESNA